MFQILTAKELSEILECSEVTARKKAKQTLSDDSQKITKKVKGREVEAFKFTSEQISSLIKEVRENKQIYSKNEQGHGENLENIINVFPDSNEIFNKPLEVNKDNVFSQNSNIKDFQNPMEILLRYEEYIKKAAKFELLEDKSNELKKDASYWQEQYFNMKYQHDTLQERYNNLFEENKSLKQELEKKNIPWWKLRK